MNKKVIFGFLGVILILFGGTLLAARLGFSHLFTMIKEPGFLFFATGSTIFFLTYFLHGVRKWGWLFPALFTAALAVIIGMETVGMEGDVAPGLLFTAWGLPFIVGAFMSRKRRLLIPGISLILFAAFLMIASSDLGEWAWVFFFGMLALAFLNAYFLMNLRWWLLLLAGGSASLGVDVALETLFPYSEYSSMPGIHLQMSPYTWAFILGLAVTCGILWLMRKSQPTGWAIYPAVGLFVLSGLDFVLGPQFQAIGLAITFFLLGIVIIISQIHNLISRQHRSQSQPGVIK